MREEAKTMKPRTILSVPILLLLFVAMVGWPACAQAQDDNLLAVVIQGDVVRVRHLLDHGADVNMRNFRQDTPLHLAAEKGRTEVATLLIERGANVDAKNEDQATPLYLAAWNGHTESVTLLINKGANVNARASDQSTPLHTAAAHDHSEVAALLIANGANVNARDVHQKTPLHWAATTGSLRTAKVLVEHGGDIGLRDSDGNTPIQLAEQSMGRNLALALRETGSASLPGTSSQKDFREYLSLIASQRDRDQQSACEEEHYLNSRGDDSIRRVCHLFVSVELRKKIIQSVLTMTSPPAISEEAKRAFVEGNVFFRGAKSTADYNLAVNKYKEALTEAPWWGLAYNNLGIALRDAGRLDEAKTALELYLLTKPADASTAQMTIYEIGGQQQLAEEHKRQERDRQIQCAQECRDGNTARGRGSSGYNDAIQHYKKAAEICSDPRDSAVMYAGLGDVYRLQGNLDEAYKYMQEAFELDPNPQGDRRWIYSNFGVLLDNRGDHAAACQCWRKGCNAGDATSCSNLSRCP